MDNSTFLSESKEAGSGSHSQPVSMNYITGSTIKALREYKKLTQRELAALLSVTDKAISKWETGRGYPDIETLTPLAEALGVNIAELITGNVIKNSNRSANIRKMNYYVCPMCGNVICSTGEAHISCCGIELPPSESEETSDSDVAAQHEICVERIEDEYYVSMKHEMSKSHYISFIVYSTSDHFELKKLYPEQSAEARFFIKGHGTITVYCNKHGRYQLRI